MAAVNLTDVATQTGVAKVGRIDAGDTVSRRFAAAMEKAGTDPAADPQQIGAASRVLPSGQATPVDPAASATADAQERTRRALDLNVQVTQCSKSRFTVMQYSTVCKMFAASSVRKRRASMLSRRIRSTRAGCWRCRWKSRNGSFLSKRAQS